MAVDKKIPFDKRDFYFCVFKHRNKIVSIVVVATLLVIAGVYVWPTSYEAKARFLVKLGRENASMPATVQRASPVITSGVTRNDINSEIEIIKSRLLAENTIKELGLDFLFPPPVVPQDTLAKLRFYLKRVVSAIKDAVLWICYRLDLIEELDRFEKGVKILSKKLDASNGNNSDIIEVSLRWDSPEKAAKILDTLLDLYLKRHSEVHSTPGTALFFKNQLDRYKDMLSRSEEELKNFKKHNEISEIALEKKILLEQIGRARTELQAATTRRIETQEVVANLKKQVRMQEYRVRLMDLQSELKDAGNGPRVSSIKDEIARIKGLIRSEEESIAGTTRSVTNTLMKDFEKKLIVEQNNLLVSRIRESNLRKYVKELEDKIKKLDEAEIELARLERQRKHNENYYALYLEKYEEARISDVMDRARIVNVNVLDPPLVPFEPVWPKKVPTITAAFFGSIFVGIMFALFLEFVNPSLKTEDDVEHYLQLQHLITIPEYD